MAWTLHILFVIAGKWGNSTVGICSSSHVAVSSRRHCPCDQAELHRCQSFACANDETGTDRTRIDGVNLQGLVGIFRETPDPKQSKVSLRSLFLSCLANTPVEWLEPCNLMSEGSVGILWSWNMLSDLICFILCTSYLRTCETSVCGVRLIAL